MKNTEEEIGPNAHHTKITHKSEDKSSKVPNPKFVLSHFSSNISVLFYYKMSVLRIFFMTQYLGNELF